MFVCWTEEFCILHSAALDYIIPSHELRASYSRVSRRQHTYFTYNIHRGLPQHFMPASYSQLASCTRLPDSLGSLHLVLLRGHGSRLHRGSISIASDRIHDSSVAGDRKSSAQECVWIYRVPATIAVHGRLFSTRIFMSFFYVVSTGAACVSSSRLCAWLKRLLGLFVRDA